MIIINNEELLRKPCEDVLPEEVGELCELLERELNNSARLGCPGIGLALPQIGIYKKMAILRFSNKELDVNLINCNITQGYDKIMVKDEGCLSFPGRVENTMRFQEVLITGNLIYPNNMILTGLVAIASQHEIDHLNGILLIDRALPKQSLKIGPNNPCHCGSNIKYKKCCYKLQ